MGGLKEAYYTGRVRLPPLFLVQARLNTEKRSRTENFALDVKGIDVKTELDQSADVLIVPCT